MHRERNSLEGGSSKAGIFDKKRIHDVLDKHLERTSPSTSRGFLTNPKEKDSRVSVPSTSARKTPSDYSGLNSSKNRLDEEQNELIESAAEMLYGLIHVRYILTSKGMTAMLEKYKRYEFGRCPRIYCSGQACLPVGQSDIPRSGTVKMYCPKCEDIYYPRSKYTGNIDGAYFGTTFPHLFLMTYANAKPTQATKSYVPRVFGFKVHKP